ncbi:type II-A CRISPR-associated protein Csn2 [Vagococcus penaei]|uniref:Type II-A CRISPR-associated protein Csn2 n=1 Tax=Vagococcus penaei TaxID=633807 RepID=A0A1Q2D5E9_9ENTE|nr:type II-A CRISPR-associated protein Csn2 [Vagococcus penaei]AQP53603.1 type II-A CRISPR-associated protein Csn2 [Vagococcus penaei]RSU07547.1 type II-A CRISPR-associated protein Csn2 [Vagococcus penaei]
MRHINFPILDEPLSINKATFLVVEERDLFTRLIRLFYQYEEAGELKLYKQDYQSINKSELLVITDILGFDINAASVLKLIYSDLEQQLNESPDVKTQIEDLSLGITRLIEVELLNHELDLELDDITFLELLKILGVKIETKTDTLFEKMLEIIQVFKYLSKKKFIVFINVCSYFNQEELIKISEYISLFDSDVLFLEHYKIEGVNQFIIDKDYYVTSETML